MALPKHEHFLYRIGLQPRRVIEIVEKDKYLSCAETIPVDKDDAKEGYFQWVAGTKRFCTYILVYHNSQIKAASDAKVRIPRVSQLVT